MQRLSSWFAPYALRCAGALKLTSMTMCCVMQQAEAGTESPPEGQEGSCVALGDYLCIALEVTVSAD